MDDGPDAPVYDSISELFNAVMILSENQWIGGEVSESILRTSNLTKFEGNAVSGVTFDEKVVEPEEIQNAGLNPLLTSAPSFVYARMPLFDGKYMYFYSKSSSLTFCLEPPSRRYK